MDDQSTQRRPTQLQLLGLFLLGVLGILVAVTLFLGAATPACSC